MSCGVSAGALLLQVPSESKSAGRASPLGGPMLASGLALLSLCTSVCTSVRRGAAEYWAHVGRAPGSTSMVARQGRGAGLSSRVVAEAP